MMATNHDDRFSEHIYQNWSIPNQSLQMGEPIGTGATCEVFQAKLKTPDGVQDVAVKKLLTSHRNDNQNQSTPEEIIFLKSLEHRNIIRFIGVVISPGKPLRIVTELASKGSLYDYLKTLRSKFSRLTEKQFIIWTMDAAYAIQFLQNNKVAHRDIKSMNFVITSDDVLKLCDFGIAKNMERTMEMSVQRGTFRWMAPEVFKDLEFSLASDIYSFGIVVWELHTCDEPFKGLTVFQVINAVGNDNKRPDIPADCPDNIRNMLVQCWESDHKIRPKIDDIVDRLEKEYNEQQVPSLTDILQEGPNTVHIRNRDVTKHVHLGHDLNYESYNPKLKAQPLYANNVVGKKLDKHMMENDTGGNFASSYNPKPIPKVTLTQPLYANNVVGKRLDKHMMENDTGGNCACHIENPAYVQSQPTDLVAWDSDSDTSSITAGSDHADIGLTRDGNLPSITRRIGNLYLAHRTCCTIDGNVIIKEGEMIEVIDVDSTTGNWYISLRNGTSGFVKPDNFMICDWMKKRKSSSLSDLRESLIEDLDKTASDDMCTNGSSSRMDPSITRRMKPNSNRRRSVAHHYHRLKLQTIFGLTRCNYCRQFVRGGIKQALKCSDCGIVVHPRCENSVSCCKYQPED